MRDDPFRGVSRTAMTARIDDACISPEDRMIARMRIIDRAKWADIGAEVGCDRRTASRHFNDIKDLI